MVVIAHEAVGMAVPVEPLYNKAQDVEKRPLIGIVDKEFCPRVATRGYVVQGTGIFYAEGASHECLSSQEMMKYKT
jgi:hypothetical protein